MRLPETPPMPTVLCIEDEAHLGRLLEQIFAVPGMGNLLVQSVNLRDYPYVQAMVLLIGTWVMLSNIGIDVAYGYLDPRIRMA